MWNKVANSFSVKIRRDQPHIFPLCRTFFVFDVSPRVEISHARQSNLLWECNFSGVEGVSAVRETKLSTRFFLFFDKSQNFRVLTLMLNT